jgi:hypothetical protein
MNPEFRRNLWLEMTPRRVVFMAVVLALIFFAAALSSGNDYRPAWVAELLYYFIVVFWGSRNAALSVVGEIRDRTWDSQRLSSLGASTMTWGKLFGSTIYNWFGGAICLTVLLVSEFVHQGAATALIDLVYFVGIGVISQAAALLASLIFARRRQAHSRLGAFVYQIAGIVAAVCVYAVWNAADPGRSFGAGKKSAEFVVWWGHAFDGRVFLLVSLAVFAAWTLVGCYRQMRLELKMRNGPFVWLGFLLFMGLYAAGFDAWLFKGPEVADWHGDSLRIALAMSTFGILAYVMVLLEPKEPVLYRWMGGQIAAGHPERAFFSLQAWQMSYFAAIATAAALFARLAQIEGHWGPAPAVILTAAGFLTRDVSLFVLFQSLPGRRRGDFAAVVALVALYALIPAIMSGLGLGNALPFFYPKESDQPWLAAAVVWGEAIIVAALTFGRLASAERPTGELVQA